MCLRCRREVVGIESWASRQTKFFSFPRTSMFQIVDQALLFFFFI